MTPTSVKCVPDSDLVHALADRLADEYASEGVYAKFLHAAETRELIYYRVGDDGWLLDRQALGDQVLRALETGEETTVVPDYDYTWYWKSYYPYYRVGDTFVEISLDNQYLWYFVDGELLVETPVVTGDLAKRDDTRKGCFRIYYKDADTYLQGTTATAAGTTMWITGCPLTAASACTIPPGGTSTAGRSISATAPTAASTPAGRHADHL